MLQIVHLSDGLSSDIKANPGIGRAVAAEREIERPVLADDVAQRSPRELGVVGVEQRRVLSLNDDGRIV